MSRHDGGKGDTQRPLGVSMDEFDESWEKIFGNKTTKPQPQIEPIPFGGMVDTGEEDAK
jgi:hypothetical protein